MAKDVFNQISNISGMATGAVATGANLYRNFSKYSNSAKTKNASHIRDLFTNGFLSRNSVFVPQYYARMFDEPTYLTFRIEFNFDTDDNIISSIDNNTIYTATDNAYKLYDYMPEPLLVKRSNVKKISAYSYLKDNLGEYGRAEILSNMIDGLKDVQNIFPYYFKSIEGLSNIMKIDPKRGQRLGDDAVITLKCYEGLDLKMNQILQNYKKVVWDDLYQRWVLPDMMRFFNMKIYISEIRLFHEYRNLLSVKKPTLYNFSDGDVRNMTYIPQEKYQKILGAIDKGITTASVISEKHAGTNSTFDKGFDTAQGVYQDIEGGVMGIINGFGELCNNAINDVMPTICLECKMCEFDISETGGFINNLSSSKESNNPVEATLKIKVGNVIERQVYPLNVNLETINERGYNIRTKYYIDDELLDKNYTSSVSGVDGSQKYEEDVKHYAGEKKISTTLHKYTKADYAKGETSSIYNYTTEDKLSYNPRQPELDESDMAGAIIGDAYSTANMLGNVVEGAAGISHSTATDGKSINTVDLGIKEMYEAQAASYKADSQSTQKIIDPYRVDANNEETAKPSQESIYASNINDLYNNAGKEISREMLKATAEKIYTSPTILSMAISSEDKVKIMNNVYDNVLDNMQKTNVIEDPEVNKTINSIREMLKETYQPEKKASSSAFDLINGK